MKKIIIYCTLTFVLLNIGKTISYGQQSDILLSWYPQCPDTCTSHETCTYLTEFTVVNYCVNPPVVLCYGSQWVNCSSSSAEFIGGCECEDATSNPCFLVIGRATKYCNGPGGNIAKCTGSGSKNVTCWQLMHYVTQIPITWQ
jgi:hypothetical protein